MNYNASKLIEIVDPQAQIIRETELTEKPVQQTPIFEIKKANGRPATLMEVAENNLSVFPSLLRDGLRAILFESYAAVPQTFQLWARTETSDKPQENWLADSGVGLLPIVGEGSQYPHIVRDLDSVVSITNEKRGGIISVTEEMIFFNRVGVLRQQAQMLARAMAMTKEQAAYNVLTTVGNYTLNSTTNDNDIGANTTTTTFSAAGLELAHSTLSSMKDRKSGMYLGVRPNTLVVGPRLEFAAKQLLLSPEVGGMGDTSAVITYGTGRTNPFRGLVDSIIVSPFVNSYHWILMERMQAIVHQVVWPLQLLQGTMSADNAEYLNFDVINYRARELFGFGMLNQHYAHFSDSTTAPTVT